MHVNVFWHCQAAHTLPDDPESHTHARAPTRACPHVSTQALRYVHIARTYACAGAGSNDPTHAPTDNHGHWLVAEPSKEASMTRELEVTTTTTTQMPKTTTRRCSLPRCKAAWRRPRWRRRHQSEPSWRRDRRPRLDSSMRLGAPCFRRSSTSHRPWMAETCRCSRQWRVCAVHAHRSSHSCCAPIALAAASTPWHA